MKDELSPTVQGIIGQLEFGRNEHLPATGCCGSLFCSPESGDRRNINRLITELSVLKTDENTSLNTSELFRILKILNAYKVKLKTQAMHELLCRIIYGQTPAAMAELAQEQSKELLLLESTPEPTPVSGLIYGSLPLGLPLSSAPQTLTTSSSLETSTVATVSNVPPPVHTPTPEVLPASFMPNIPVISSTPPQSPVLGSSMLVTTSLATTTSSTVWSPLAPPNTPPPESPAHNGPDLPPPSSPPPPPSMYT